MKIKTNIIFKTICVILTITFLVNDVSFASEEMRSLLRQGYVGQACLAAPLRSAPICGVTTNAGIPLIVSDPAINSLRHDSPLYFFLQTIASSLVKGLEPQQAIGLLFETVIKRYPDDPKIQRFKMSGLRREPRAGGDVLVLPFKDIEGASLVFTREPYDENVHILKFDFPQQDPVTIRVEGVDWKKPETTPPTPSIQPPQISPTESSPPQTKTIQEPRAEEPQAGKDKPDQAKFQGIGDKLNKPLGWIKERWDYLRKEWGRFRNSPIYSRSVLIGGIALSCLTGTLTGFQAVLGICWCQAYEETLAQQRRQDLERALKAKDREETKNIQKAIHDAKEEHAALVEAIEEEMADAGEIKEFKLNLRSDRARNDFIKYITRATVDYFKNTAKDVRSFDDFINKMIAYLKENVFKNPEDTPEKIRRLLMSDTILPKLRNIYANGDRDIEPQKIQAEVGAEPAASEVMKRVIGEGAGDATLPGASQETGKTGFLGGGSTSTFLLLILAGAAAAGVMLALPVARGLMMGVPVVLGECWLREWYRRKAAEEAERLEKAKKDRKETERIKADIEESGKEMKELVDELAEEMDEEPGDFKTKLKSDRVRHDIFKYIEQGAGSYFNETARGERSFDAYLKKIARILKEKVFKNDLDTVEKIEGYLRRGGIQEVLRKIYVKGDRELTPGKHGPREHGDEHEPAASAVLRRILHEQGIADHSHPWDGHGGLNSHTTGLIIAFVLAAGASIFMRFVLGLDDAFLIMPFIAGMAVIGSQGAEEEEVSGENLIKKYTGDLDVLAAKGKIDDTYYIDEIGTIDSQAANDKAHNFVITGDPVLGQGVIEAAVARKSSLKTLKDARFLEIDTALFVDQLAVPGMVDALLKKLVAAIQREAESRQGRTVIVLNFRDYVETPIVSGRGGKSIETVFAQLSRAIRSKNLSVVVITPPSLYEKTVSNTSKYNDYFVRIDLSKPEPLDLAGIARAHVMKFKETYKRLIPEGVSVRVQGRVIDDVLEMIPKYYTGVLSVTKFRELSDRVITKKFGQRGDLEAELADVRERIMRAGRELARATRAAAGRDEIDFLEVTLDRLEKRYAAARQSLADCETALETIMQAKRFDITVEDYEEMIAAELNIPVDDIRKKESDKLREYPARMGEMLKGQDEVIIKSHRALERRQSTGDRGSNKPKWAGLFIGPTGVGKTEFARALGRHFFGSEDAVIRFDMSEFMLEQQAQRLFGPPPGYVGFEEGGELTEKVHRKPYSVILLDEIEKAHESVFNTLLQILDKGELTDNKGKVTSFKNSIIIMTSNVGFSEIAYSEKLKDSHLEKVDKKIKGVMETIDKEYDQIKVSDELAKALNSLRILAAELKRRGKKDPELDADIKEIDGLFCDIEKLIQNDVLDQKKKELMRHFAGARQYIAQARRLTIHEKYNIIARYKGIADTDEEKAAKEIGEVDRILKTEKAGVRYILQEELKDPGHEQYGQYMAQYIRLCEVLAEGSSAKRVRGMCDYFRWDVKRMIIETMRIDPEIRTKFKPELLGRIGLSDVEVYDEELRRKVDISNIISFDPLSRDDLEEILKIKMRETDKLLEDEGFGSLTLSPALREFVIEKGFDVSNGARPLERSIRVNVLGRLSEEILSGRMERRHDIYADMKDGVVVFEMRKRSEEASIRTLSEGVGKVRSEAADGKDMDDAALAGLLGIEPPQKETGPLTDEELEAAVKRLEIDVPLPDLGIDPDILTADAQTIKDRLTKVTRELAALKQDIERLNIHLQAGDAQQKVAVGRELMKKEALGALLLRRKETLQARVEGRDADIQQILENADKEQQEKAVQARKDINDCFENLTLSFLKGDLRDAHPPVETVTRMAGILRQSVRNYPMVIDASPIVQSEVVDSLACKAAGGAMPELKDARILRLDLAGMREYLSVVGLFEVRMKEIADVIEADDKEKSLRTIIVVDFDEARSELDRLRANPFMLGYFLRLFKSYETISFIMTTSRPNVTQDEMFQQYFSQVSMPEQDRNRSMENFYLFMRQSLTGNGNGSGSKPVEISFEAMRMAHRIWDQYFSGFYAPGKLKRWFGSLVSRTMAGTSGGRVVLRGKLETMLREIGFLCQELMGEDITFEKLAQRPELRKLTREIHEKIQELDREQSAVIGAGETLEFLREFEKDESGTDIDADLFLIRTNEDLLRLEERLGRRVIGQDDALSQISRVVRIAKAGLKRRRSPIGSFIFAGPTGVGKTQLAETVASKMGMSAKRIDFGSMTGAWDVARLIGAPPGFVGFADKESVARGTATRGEIIEHMLKNPRSVIIFDEIDKANRDILNILLQIMEDGRVTAGDGTTVYFNEAVIILTTNLGMEPFNPENLVRMGISPDRAITANTDLAIEPLYDQMAAATRSQEPGDDDAMKKFKEKMDGQIGRAAKFYFRPEFLNRIDGLVVFNPLSVKTVEKIAAIFVEEVAHSTALQWKVDVRIGASAEEHAKIISLIAGKGYTPKSGARDMDLIVGHFFTNGLNGFIKKHTDQILAARGKGSIIAHYDQAAHAITFELRRETDEAQSDLPAEDKTALTVIAQRIRDKGGVPPDLDDLKEAFGLITEVGAEAGEKLVIGGQSVTTGNSDFLNTGDEVAETVDAKVASIIPGAVVPPEGSNKTPAKVAASLKRLVGSWAMNALELAKMANTASYAWHNEGRNLRGDDYYNRETGELHDMVGKYFERMADTKHVTIRWEYAPGIIKACVEFDSRLSTFLKRELFGNKYETVESVNSAAPRALQGLLKAKLAIEKLGGKANFYCENGNTTLWMSLPVEEPKKPAPVIVPPGPTPGEIAAAGITTTGPPAEAKAATSVRDIMVSLGYAGLGDKDYPPGEYEVYDAKPLKEGLPYIKEYVSFTDNTATYLHVESDSKITDRRNSKNKYWLFEYNPGDSNLILNDSSGQVKVSVNTGGIFQVDNSGNLPRFLIPAHIYAKLVKDGAEEILKATHVEAMEATSVPAVVAAGTAVTPQGEKPESTRLPKQPSIAKMKSSLPLDSKGVWQLCSYKKGRDVKYYEEISESNGTLLIRIKEADESGGVILADDYAYLFEYDSASRKMCWQGDTSKSIDVKYFNIRKSKSSKAGNDRAIVELDDKAYRELMKLMGENPFRNVSFRRISPKPSAEASLDSASAETPASLGTGPERSRRAEGPQSETSQAVPRTQPTIEEMMKNCGQRPNEDWVLYDGENRLGRAAGIKEKEEINFSTNIVVQRYIYGEDWGRPAVWLIYNPSSNMLGYTVEGKPAVSYSNPNLYFNVIRTDETHAVIEINETAYRDLEQKGAKLGSAFVNVTFKIVPDTPAQAAAPGGKAAESTPAQPAAPDQPPAKPSLDSAGAETTASLGTIRQELNKSESQGEPEEVETETSPMTEREIKAGAKIFFDQFYLIVRLRVAGRVSSSQKRITKEAKRMRVEYGSAKKKLEEIVGQAKTDVLKRISNRFKYAGRVSPPYENSQLNVNVFYEEKKYWEEYIERVLSERAKSAAPPRQPTIAQPELPTAYDVASFLRVTFSMSLNEGNEYEWIGNPPAPGYVQYINYSGNSISIRCDVTDPLPATYYFTYDAGLKQLRWKIKDSAGQEREITADGDNLYFSVRFNVTANKVEFHIDKESYDKLARESNFGSIFNSCFSFFTVIPLSGREPVAAAPQGEPPQIASRRQPTLIEMKNELAKSFPVNTYNGNFIICPKTVTGPETSFSEEMHFDNSSNSVCVFHYETSETGASSTREVVYCPSENSLTYFDKKLGMKKHDGDDIYFNVRKIDATHAVIEIDQKSFDDLRQQGADLSFNNITFEVIPGALRTTQNAQRTTNKIPNPDPEPFAPLRFRAGYIETYYTPTPNGIWQARIVPNTAAEFNQARDLSSGEVRDEDGNTFEIDAQNRCVIVKRPSGEPNEDYGPGGTISQRVGKFGPGMSFIGINPDGSIVVLDVVLNYLSIVSRMENSPMPAPQPQPEPQPSPRVTPPDPEVEVIVDKLIDIAKKGSGWPTNVQVAARKALGNFDGNQKAIIALLDLSPSDVAHAALRKIAKGDRTAIDAIIARNTGVAEVSGEDVKTLGEIAEGDKQAIEFLLKVVKKEIKIGWSDFPSVFEALKKIAPKEDPDAITALQNYINANDDITTRMKATEALGAISPGDNNICRRYFRGIINDYINTSAVDKALEAAKVLSEIEPVDPIVLNTVLKIINEPNVDEKLLPKFLDILGPKVGFNNAAAVSDVTAIINSPRTSPSVRLAAAKALARIDPGNEEAHQELLKFGKVVDDSGQSNKAFDYEALDYLFKYYPGYKDTVLAMDYFARKRDAPPQQRKECLERLAGMGDVNFPGYNNDQINDLLTDIIRDPNDAMEMRAFAARCYYRRNPDEKEIIGAIANVMDKAKTKIESLEPEKIGDLTSETANALSNEGAMAIRTLESLARIEPIKDNYVSFLKGEFKWLAGKAKQATSEINRRPALRMLIQTAESLFNLGASDKDMLNFLVKTAAPANGAAQEPSVTIAAIEALGRVAAKVGQVEVAAEADEGAQTGEETDSEKDRIFFDGVLKKNMADALPRLRLDREKIRAIVERGARRVSNVSEFKEDDGELAAVFLSSGDVLIGSVLGKAASAGRRGMLTLRVFCRLEKGDPNLVDLIPKGANVNVEDVESMWLLARKGERAIQPAYENTVIKPLLEAARRGDEADRREAFEMISDLGEEGMSGKSGQDAQKLLLEKMKGERLTMAERAFLHGCYYRFHRMTKFEDASAREFLSELKSEIGKFREKQYYAEDVEAANKRGVDLIDALEEMTKIEAANAEAVRYLNELFNELQGTEFFELEKDKAEVTDVESVLPKVRMLIQAAEALCKIGPGNERALKLLTTIAAWQKERDKPLIEAAKEALGRIEALKAKTISAQTVAPAPNGDTQFGPKPPNIRNYTDGHSDEEMAYRPRRASAPQSSDKPARKKSFKAMIPGLKKELGQACDELNPQEPQSLILYADDIINKTALYDLKDALKVLKDKKVLAGGKIFLYTKAADAEMAQKVKGLEALINLTLGAQTEVVIIRPQEYTQLVPYADDPVKEIGALVRICGGRDVDAKNILGAIRGNGINWGDTFKDYEEKIPPEMRIQVVIMNDNEYGALAQFSLIQAILEAMKRKAARKDIAQGALGSWIICLEPIRILTASMYRDYIRYRDNVLSKA